MSTPDLLLQKAHAAHAAGDLATAARLASEAIKANPNDPNPKVLLGVIRGKENKNAEAIELFQQALQQQPDSFESLFWLSVLFRRIGDLDQAIAYAKQADQVRPNDPHALNNLGMALMAAQRLPEAEAAFRKSLSVNAQMPPVHFNLGAALQLQGKDQEAAVAFQNSLRLNSNNPDALVALGHLAMTRDDPASAVTMGRQALRLNPNHAPAQLLIALGLIHDGRTPEATPFLQRAIQLKPQDAGAIATLGTSLQSQGRIEEANEQFKKSIEIQPRQGYAYFALVHNHKVKEEERPLVQEMESLANEPTLGAKEINFLHYGLGKAYENLGDYELAMRHLDEANRYAKQLKLGQALFDKKAYEENIDRIIRLFSKELIEGFGKRPLPLTPSPPGSPLPINRDQPESRLRSAAGANPQVEGGSDLPIFILGMMRSGTTLVEQILSSHPEVEAAGEQAFWTANVTKSVDLDLKGLNAKILADLAGQYTQLLRRIGPAAKHVTDKMPANYMAIGFLHLAFPNSPIIHTRRNPVDTCISIYATPNRRPIDFAHDKENITFAYEQYLRLMEHWRKVLPPGRMLEVDYEDMVADRDGVTRRLLEYCKLPWDEACAAPEKNERTVVTPSVWQVRQPIYSSSVERWRHFEPWLGPFKRLLGGGSR